MVGSCTVDYQLVQELHGDDVDEVGALHHFLIGLAMGVECHVESKDRYFLSCSARLIRRLVLTSTTKYGCSIVDGLIIVAHG